MDSETRMHEKIFQGLHFTLRIEQLDGSWFERPDDLVSNYARLALHLNDVDFECVTFENVRRWLTDGSKRGGDGYRSYDVHSVVTKLVNQAAVYLWTHRLKMEGEDDDPTIMPIDPETGHRPPLVEALSEKWKFNDR